MLQRIRIAAAVALASGLALGVGCEKFQGRLVTQDPTEPPSHDERLGAADLVIKNATRELKSTRVVATLSEPMREGQSLLWCSTLQLAFDALETELGPPVKVSPNNPVITAMIESAPASDTIDNASYVAMAGFGRDDILGRIQTALEETFGGAASPKLLPPSVSPDDIFAYAYLFKDLSFEWPLLRGEWGLGFQGVEVAHFGYWDDHKQDPDRRKRWEQIRVLQYDDRENWSVEIATKSPEDRLIIARAGNAHAATLGDAVQWILSHESEEPAGGGRIARREDLRIPVMNFDVTRRFEELQGASLLGTQTGGVITDAMQNIRFRLDEKGAILKSEAAIGVTSAPFEDDPRQFVCDGPFYILMMRAGASEPCFAGYFATPELLVRFKE